MVDFAPTKTTEKVRKKYQKYLIPGEELVLVTGIGRRYFWLKFLFTLPFGLILVGLPSLSRLYRERHSVRYILTNHRFIIKKGLFSIKVTSAPYDKVTHITVDESFTNRFIYNAGDISLITAGFDQREIVIGHVGDPIQFKNLMEHLILKDKQKSEGSKEGFDEEIRPLKLD